MSKPLLNKNCPQCKAPFLTHKEKQSFCSSKCRSAHWMATHLQKVEKPQAPEVLEFKIRELKGIIEEQQSRIEFLEKLLDNNSIYHG